MLQLSTKARIGLLLTGSVTFFFFFKRTRLKYLVMELYFYFCGVKLFNVYVAILQAYSSIRRFGGHLFTGLNSGGMVRVDALLARCVVDAFAK